MIERRCNLCDRPLDNDNDPLSKDCGGDCLKCMADFGNDPDAIAAVEEILSKLEVKKMYIVVTETDLKKFTTTCSTVMALGGTPVGGMSAVDTATRSRNFPKITYIQAFIVPTDFKLPDADSWVSNDEDTDDGEPLSAEELASVRLKQNVVQPMASPKAKFMLTDDVTMRMLGNQTLGAAGICKVLTALIAEVEHLRSQIKDKSA